MESEILLRESETWGIEVSRKPEWYEPAIKIPESFKIHLSEMGRTEINDEVREHLNRQGRAMVTKQIREARRAGVKWWVEVLTPVLALAVALLSIFKDIIVELLKK